MNPYTEGLVAVLWDKKDLEDVLGVPQKTIAVSKNELRKLVEDAAVVGARRALLDAADDLDAGSTNAVRRGPFNLFGSPATIKLAEGRYLRLRADKL